MKSTESSADRRPTIGRSSADSQNPKTVGRWKKIYNKVVIIYFLSADEKRAKIWHFIGRKIGRSSADCRPTVGGVNVIAVVVIIYFLSADEKKKLKSGRPSAVLMLSRFRGYKSHGAEFEKRTRPIARLKRFSWFIWVKADLRVLWGIVSEKIENHKSWAFTEKKWGEDLNNGLVVIDR